VTEEQKPAQELTLQQHAEQELATVEQGIAALREKWGGVVFDVETTKGLDQAKAARLEIRQPRYDVQRIVKAKKSELAQISRDVGARGEAIIEQIMEIEAPVHQQIEAVEARKAAEKAERERIERENRQRQLDRVIGIRAVPASLIGASVDEIDTATTVLLEDDLSDLDEVYLPDARQARDKAIEDLQVMRAQRAEADALAAELRQLQAEREAREAQLAEQRRQEAEAQAAREAEEAQRKAAEAAAHAAELAAERERAAALQRQLDEQAAEQKRREDAEASERARIAQEAADAEAARERAEAEERAQREREAQEQAIQRATVWEAMEEALGMLEALGHGDSVPARKLRSALDRGDGAV